MRSRKDAAAYRESWMEICSNSVRSITNSNNLIERGLSDFKPKSRSKKKMRKNVTPRPRQCKKSNMNKYREITKKPLK